MQYVDYLYHAVKIGKTMETKKAIYKMCFDCGRSGDLDGVFVTTEQKVKKLIESEIEVQFGEALGKHSEVYGSVTESEISFVTDDEDFVIKFEHYGLDVGYNPFEYMSTNFEIDGIDTEDLCVDEIIELLIKIESENN
jgi:hypothetical protein